MIGRALHCALLVALGGAACAQQSAPAPKVVTPVESRLGTVDFRTSCDAAVQPELNRAVALLHHMTYVTARAAFRGVSERDPRCAMAHWGVAMTLFQPLWPTRPSAADLAAGWEATQKARALPKSEREERYVDAVAAFFENPADGDYWQRIDRWAAAMQALQAKYPEDPEASAFCALALLASARPGPDVDAHSRRAVAMLLPIHRSNPYHPGAMHYVIHANDVPGRERENLDIVRRYEEVAPDNPHALHMPTHIYTRLGDWDGVIRGNLRAANAALRYPVGEHGNLVWDEFPHAIEYLVYAYLQQGADSEASSQIQRLLGTANLEPSAKTAFHLASTRARFVLERHAWREAATLVPREPAVLDWDRFPWPEAVMWFARAYGSLRAGDATESPRAITRLTELEQKAAGGEAAFARQIKMLRLMLEAWSAHAAGDDARALSLSSDAIELEAATPKPPVTPAATVPASELQGDLLLEMGRPREALAAYRKSLQSFPRRFNGTLGVARALAAVGDDRGATVAYCELFEIGARGSRASSLEEPRRLGLEPATLATRCRRE